MKLGQVVQCTVVLHIDYGRLKRDGTLDESSPSSEIVVIYLI